MAKVGFYLTTLDACGLILILYNYSEIFKYVELT